MKPKQEVKITYDNKGEVFFFAHSFKTAMEHANDYINRNRGKIAMNVYILNERNVGERWILFNQINK